MSDAMMIDEMRPSRPSSADQLVIPADERERAAQYDDVLERVRRLLIEQLHLQREPDEIDPDSVLFATGLGLDSVDAVELTVAIETEFAVQIPDNEQSREILRTVNSVVVHLISKLNEGTKSKEEAKPAEEAMLKVEAANVS
jgi:acyl carrier protein